MRHLLIALLLLYRRFLSGRGPLRHVTCTFHRTETCSAFALRTARASSFLTALFRIRRRLRRCSATSIYALSPTQLGWGRDHDRPLPSLLTELHADAETPASISTILATRTLVSRYRHDLPDLLALTPARRLLPPAQIMLRRGQVHRSQRRITTSVLGLTAGQ